LSPVTGLAGKLKAAIVLLLVKNLFYTVLIEY